MKNFFVCVLALFVFSNPAFTLQVFAQEPIQVADFLNAVHGELDAWGWPMRGTEAFGYDSVVNGHTFQVLVTYFLRDGGARIERADFEVDIRNLNAENYKYVANEVVESVFKLFQKAKEMEKEGELTTSDSYITLTDQELDLWKKLLSVGQKTYSEESKYLLSLNSDFVRINQIYGFFDEKRVTKVIIVVTNNQSLQEFHPILNISFEELSVLSSDEDFLNVARRAYKAAELFLKTRKLKIAD